MPQADLVKWSKDWIKAGGKAVKPWDAKGFRLPGGAVYSKAGMMTFPPANAIYRRETYDNYPAARAIMSCVYEGLQLPIDAALRVESRYFTQVLRSNDAAAMIRRLFLSMQELNKRARRPATGRFCWASTRSRGSSSRCTLPRAGGGPVRVPRTCRARPTSARRPTPISRSSASSALPVR